MNKCEWCGKEFDNKEGKLKFCSHSCRSKYAASKVKNHVCNFGKSANKRAKEAGWKCPYCGEIFRTRREKQTHVKEVHPEMIGVAWNKGLSKATNMLVKQAANTCKKRYENGELKIWCKGKHLDESTRKKISDGMKKAHNEKRAHNIGQSRWNNDPSWPEQWFMEVIENNFNDQKYVREYPFGKFSLDFAWPHKLKCIEIDGEQHQRFDSVKKRDAEKNRLLAENNWTILRLVWKDVYNKPKDFIKLAKNFIDGEQSEHK